MGAGDLLPGREGDERRSALPAHVRITVADTMVGRLRGLLGRRGFEGELLLAGCNDVHTFGMKQSLDIAFVNRAGIVVAVYRAVPAWCRLRKPGAYATLERFAAPGAWYCCGDFVACARGAHE